MSYSIVLITYILSAVVMLAAGIGLMFNYGKAVGSVEVEEVEDDFIIKYSQKNDWLLAYREDITMLETAIDAANKELALIRQGSFEFPSWMEQKLLACRYTAPRLKRVIPWFLGAAFTVWGILALAGFTAWSLQFSVSRFTDGAPVADLLPPNIPGMAFFAAGILTALAVIYSAFYLLVKALGSIQTDRMETVTNLGYAMEVREPLLKQRIHNLQAELSAQREDMANSLRLRRELWFYDSF